MAEGFEPYHVPQQSRRDRLRLVAQNHQGFLPFYDPSALSSSDLNPYVNPNPDGTIQGFNSNENNSFLYTPQNIQSLRDFTQPYNSGDVVAFKPEPLNQESNANSAQCLSLSLSSHYNHQNNLFTSYASTSNDVSRSSVPLGPFTGYASVLKGSRFLKPAQQVLEEFCNNGRGVPVEKVTEDSSLMEDHPMESFNAREIAAKLMSSGDGDEQRRKKSTLLTLLEEVHRRYKQYSQQIQAAVTSFEYVAGLGNSAPYANLALQTLSKHFRSINNAITDQLQFTNKAQTTHIIHGKEGSSRFGNTDRDIYGQRFPEHQPVWRPQRGLPERAVTVLRAWLFEHFLHPYPTDTDKLMLAKQTGLTRNQVSNWFINARVRLWKPLVEEIHLLETRQAQKSIQREEQNANAQNDNLMSVQSLASEIPSSSDHRIHETSKRARSELPELPVNLSYSNISSHPQGGASVNMVGMGGVSLTLGLHQNNGIGLSEPFPVNAAQRFGINVDVNDDHGFDISSFEAQNRHLHGQLLHDFVG